MAYFDRSAEDIVITPTRLFFLDSGPECTNDKKSEPLKDDVQEAAIIEQEEMFFIEDVTYISTELSAPCCRLEGAGCGQPEGYGVHTSALPTKEKEKPKRSIVDSDCGAASSWVDRIKLSPKLGRKKFHQSVHQEVKDPAEIGSQKIKHKPKRSNSLFPSSSNTIDIFSGMKAKEAKKPKRPKQRVLKKQKSMEFENCGGTQKNIAESLPLTEKGGEIVSAFNSSNTGVPSIRLRRASNPPITALIGNQDPTRHAPELSEAKQIKSSTLRKRLKNFKLPSFGNKSSSDQIFGVSGSAVSTGFLTPQTNRKLLPVSRTFLETRRSSAPDLARSNKEPLFMQLKSRAIKMDNNNNIVWYNDPITHPLDLEDAEIRSIARKILRENLEPLRFYDGKECDALGKKISKLIIDNVHILKAGSTQYKFACLVYIAAVRGDGVKATFCSLWSPAEDNFVVVDYRGKLLYGIATVIVTPA
ncbi:uncharacterized protein LOC5514386 [Nematostella vectensis]|uniref:uncharacterized protein LOC5514386 n=1 Tax=Nematostella vectensis TaxID=45351 RepID=UPI00207716D5|nr:uncharacterized protein LOC5514386 [Nematostella vectensis]